MTGSRHDAASTARRSRSATASGAGRSSDPPRDVVISVRRPQHVHFFRPAIAELRSREHRVHVFARETERTEELLAACGIEYEALAGRPTSRAVEAAYRARYDFRLARRLRLIDPDVVLACGGAGTVYAANLLSCRCVLFTDAERARYRKRFVYPAADQVCTPEWYPDDLGENHLRYPGYHELAYLHPDRFTPDPSVLDAVDAEADEPLAVVHLDRESARNHENTRDHGSTRNHESALGRESATEEDGAAGIDALEAVERLAATGARVVVIAGTDAPDEVAERAASPPPHQVHDLLHYADVFLGESGIRATESAVLGTPAVLVAARRPGAVRALAEYGLAFRHAGEAGRERAIERAASIFEGDVDWAARRRRLLSETIDTTNLVTALVEDADIGSAVFGRRPDPAPGRSRRPDWRRSTDRDR